MKPCNFSCKFCYATFNDMEVDRSQLNPFAAMKILAKLKGAGVKKITFAGGEPFLYRHLIDMVKVAKMYGMTTSIITNGFMIFQKPELLDRLEGILDWMGISIDSTNPVTNEKIGRAPKGVGSIAFSAADYLHLIKMIRSKGMKLKINTVVNAYNKDEDFNSFMKNLAKPERWKVFQALRVEGQNDKSFDEVKVSAKEFADFIERHKDVPNIVPEDNEAMTGSYLLIDPKGRLFENSAGRHTYSKPLQHAKIEDCLQELNLNREMFIKRGGIYEW